MEEDEIFAFVTNSIPSVGALDLLLLLKLVAPDGRRSDELVIELRNSTMAVSGALHRLNGAGLTVEEGGIHRYRPASSALDKLVAETEKLYAIKPAAIRQLTLRNFAADPCWGSAAFLRKQRGNL